MTNRAETSNRKPEVRDSSLGVLFELETCAFGGRAVMHQVCESVLGQKKIKLTRVMFCRYCLEYPLAEGLGRLLAAEGRKVSGGKLADEIAKKYEDHITKTSREPEKRFHSIISRAKAEKIALGALAFVPEEKAALLLKRLEPDESVTLLAAREGGVALPTRDSWKSLAGKMGLNPRGCLAIATSAVSCRSALAAGMRCVVLPDEFTEFQDFSGADIVAHEAEDASPKTILDLLRVRPSAFRR